MNHYQALTTFIFTHADNVMTEIHIKYLYDYLIILFPRYSCLKTNWRGGVIITSPLVGHFLQHRKCNRQIVLDV